MRHALLLCRSSVSLYVVTNSIFEGREVTKFNNLNYKYMSTVRFPCLVLFLSSSLISDLGGLVPAMGAMRVVVGSGQGGSRRSVGGGTGVPVVG